MMLTPPSEVNQRPLPACVSLPPMKWSAKNLRPGAKGVSASRRTDIPALYAPWFARRLEEGFAEYIPAGPPRRIRRSLLPEDVTHFTFWSKWPRPFLRPLGRLLEAGWPVLWNVTVTGLGGTPVEPNVPASDKAVAVVRELAAMVGSAAILWRYDPIFLTRRYDSGHHVATFRRLTDALAGHVGRVAVSFVAPYSRRVEPDLRAYERDARDLRTALPFDERLELLARLRDIASGAGLRLVLCCAPEERAALGVDKAECNGFAWAARVYPTLAAHRLKDRPCRPDCGCSEEVDIGVYDSCVLGCRYSYGSCDERRARALFARHDPNAPCIIP